jgi:hypothetical protein
MIRVLPFGFVAKGAAANPASILRVSLTVGPDGIIQRIDVAGARAPPPGAMGSRTPTSVGHRPLLPNRVRPVTGLRPSYPG